MSAKPGWYLTSDWQEWSRLRPKDPTWDMPLNKAHPHERDRFLAYDDAPHEYYLFGKSKVCPSVSSVCGHFFPKFDKVLWSQRMLESKDYKLGRGKYTGMSADEIVTLWDEKGRKASERGTLLHSEVEWYLNYEKARPTAKDLPEFQQFLEMYSTEILANDLLPYRTEWRLYGLPYLDGEEETDKTSYIPGTADALFIKDGTDKPARDMPLELELWDWKDSEGLKADKDAKGKGFGPVSHLYDTNYHHYCINLNLYKWMLERHYNVQVSRMVLGVVHPSFADKGGYQVHQVPVLRQETEDIVKAWWDHLVIAGSSV